jgi:hypothetical protein
MQDSKQIPKLTMQIPTMVTRAGSLNTIRSSRKRFRVREAIPCIMAKGTTGTFKPALMIDTGQFRPSSVYIRSRASSRPSWAPILRYADKNRDQELATTEVTSGHRRCETER